MQCMSKDDIFKSSDIATKIVDMRPHWSGCVKIKAMSIKDQIDFQRMIKADGSDDVLIYQTIIHSCVDDDGNRLFDEADIPLLASKSYKAIHMLFEKCMEINTLDVNLEQAAKNS